MDNFINDFMMRMDGKIPSCYLADIQNELCEMVRHYKIEAISSDMVPRSGYEPPYFREFFISKKIEGASEKTLQHYLMRLRNFFKEVNKPIERITANDVRVYLYLYQKHHGVSNRTLDSMRSVLMSFFSWYSGEGYIEKNIMSVIKPIKYREKQRSSLTDYELEKLISCCNSLRDVAIIEFLYSTGCRVSELVGVMRKDVNLDSGEVIVLGKGNKYRKVYLNARCKVAVSNYLSSRNDEEEQLFVSKRFPHHGLHKAGVEKIVKELGLTAGIKKNVCPHVIRHTTATIALQRGMSVTEIQRMLGHKNVATTMIYAEVADEMVKQSHTRCIV